MRLPGREHVAVGSLADSYVAPWRSTTTRPSVWRAMRPRPRSRPPTASCLAVSSDRNPGDRAAGGEVQRSLAGLCGVERRGQTGALRSLGDVPGDLPFGDGADVAKVTEFFDAVFGDLFGLGRKRPPGKNLRYTLELDFDEAALGCQKTIRFSAQRGLPGLWRHRRRGRAAGLQPMRALRGPRLDTTQGRLSLPPDGTAWPAPVQGRFPRVLRCKACAGTGLGECERECVVRVPPGSQAGGTQRVAGEGSPGRRGGPAGDLPCDRKAAVASLLSPARRSSGGRGAGAHGRGALGTEIDVPLLDAPVRMKIPAGTQPGSVFSRARKGLPTPGGGRGDAHVRVQVEVPSACSDEARRRRCSSWGTCSATMPILVGAPSRK